MTIYWIAGVVIPLALYGITYAIRERPPRPGRDIPVREFRAQEFGRRAVMPIRTRSGFAERAGICWSHPLKSNTGSTPALQRRNRTLAPTLQRKEGPR